MPAMLALFSTGKTCISGFKDNPALQQLIISNLRSLGARCEFNDSCLWIWPQLSPENAVLNAKDDPYVAMALILMATYTAKETTVRGIDGLLSRYPDFLTVFESLGGKYKLGTILL